MSTLRGKRKVHTTYHTREGENVMDCPGTNYDYKLGTIYTLQTDSGLYLSHPDRYRNGAGKRIFDYVYYGDKEVKKAHITTNCALTDKWWYAWVTYSLEDLRQVYQYIRSHLESEPRSKRAKHPCVGIFSKRGKYGMIEAQLHRMTDVEIADSKAKQMHTKIETAGQLKLQLAKSYPGAGLLQGVLPDISEKTPQKANMGTQKRKKQVHTKQSKQSSIAGGLFGYTLPKN